MSGPFRPAMEDGAENAENGRQRLAWKLVAEKTDVRGLDATALEADKEDYRTIPAPLPLHEHTSSEKNRPAGIRVVPYSPPRIHAGPGSVDLRKTRQPRPGSPGSVADRRRRNWQRRRLSKERMDGSAGHSAADNGNNSWHVYVDDDSDSNSIAASGGHEDEAAAWSGENSEDESASFATSARDVSSLAGSAFQTGPCVSGPRSATAALSAPLLTLSDAGRANLAEARSVHASHPLVRSRHSQDASPTPPSSAVSAASVSSLPRPNSRRHNVIAVHADKTFSLVTRADDGLSPAPASLATSSTGSFSEYHDDRRPLPSAAGRSLKSPPQSFATSTIRSSNNSQERLFSFSDALSSDHRFSSPLTSITSANLSRHDNHPVFSVSPGASTVCLEDDAPAFREPPVSNTHAPPTTPGRKSKGKGKAPATAIDTTERPPIKKASFASDHSDGSLVTASLLSFSSASALSVATNYKVYSRSSPPQEPATTVRSTSTASAVLHDASDDTVSLPSPSSSTNVVVLGVSSPAAPPLPVLRRSLDPDQTFTSLASYPSVDSFASGISSLSDSGSAPNVVLLGASSSPASAQYFDPSHADAGSVNSVLFDGDAGDTDIPSSPPLLPYHPDTTVGSFATFDSEPNYVLHNAPSTDFDAPQSSSSAASSLAVVCSRPPRATYSQESLRVAPLQPLRHHWSSEKLRLCGSRSRESLRHAASIQSLRHAASLQSLRHATSIKSFASVFGQEAASTFFAGQAFLGLSIPPVPVVTARPKDRLRHQRTLQLKRKPLPLPAPSATREEIPKQTLRHLHSSESVSSPSQTASSVSASPPSSPALPQQPQQAFPRMATEDYTHQWSGQLSTVASETDGGSVSSRAVSQSFSVQSGTPGRRLSVGATDSSRSHSYRASVSSSLALQLDDTRSRRSRGDSLLLERPQQLYLRYANSASPAGGSAALSPPAPQRTVRDHDEHGDGLADLEGGMPHQPSRTGLSGFFSISNNSLRNLHSSASSRSLGGVAFPVWARVYYGSGEHRALSRSTSMSDISQGDDYMGRASLVGGDGGHARRSGMAPNNAEGVSGTDALQRPTGVRKVTSSIWSPHLRRDRHATYFSVWEPPSVTWTAGTRSFTDRRNMQVICFAAGFICPFFWMIASVLPLPHNPQGRSEKSTGAADDGVYVASAVLVRHMAEVDEMRFQSARWWRMLNRVMSVFGLLILGAIAALVVVGVRDHWGR